MKKVVLAALMAFVILLNIVPTISYADDTTATVVVGSSGNVTANLGVATPANADVNVNINAGTASLEVNGVTPNQVSIGGSNVQGMITNTSATTANAVHTSLQGVMFNEENYKMWVVPLQRKLDATLTNVDYMNSNLVLAMEGVAKVISVLQEQDARLKSQQQLMAQLSDSLSASILDRQKLVVSMTEQFGYVDSQLQKSIDRDNITLEAMRNLSKNVSAQIDDHDRRLQLLVDNYVVEKLATEHANKAISDRIDSLNGVVIGLMVALGVFVAGFVLSLLYNPHRMITPKQ